MHLKVLEGSWILIFFYFLKDLKIPWKLQSVLEIPWISVLTLSNPKEKEQPQKYLQYKIAHEELLKKTRSFFCMHWMESLKNRNCALETEAKKVYCNPFQSFSTLPIRFSFCICCIIYTFFSCFEQLFLCFTQFGGGSHDLNFD